MDPIFSQQFQMPAGLGAGDYGSAPTGMFGSKANLRDALMAAVAGFMARRSPQVSNGIFDALQRKQALAQQEAQYNRRRQDQFNDQIAMYDYKLAHPEPGQQGEFEQRLIASGVQPGTPKWTQAMQQSVQNTIDPVVMTPYGPMLRSQITGAQKPEVLTSLPPGAKPIGGPTPQASGGFPGY